MKNKTCPVCGEPVRVIGNTTMSYESVAVGEIEKLRAENERLKALVREACGYVRSLKCELGPEDYVFENKIYEFLSSDDVKQALEGRE